MSVRETVMINRILDFIASLTRGVALHQLPGNLFVDSNFSCALIYEAHLESLPATSTGETALSAITRRHLIPIAHLAVVFKISVVLHPAIPP